MANENVQETKGKVGFAVGTGRCGTKFLAEVIQLEPHISSVHERNPLNEAFHRYCNWYRLPVDHGGFIETKAAEIRQDLESYSFSFESSAYLSLSIQELFEAFDAKFVLLVRSPERVVNSFYHKGWYKEPFTQADPQLALGYQESKFFHHFLARFSPPGDEFLRWNQMSRVGKLAWFWNSLNASTFRLFENIPDTHWRIEKLENLTYQRYQDIVRFWGVESSISEQTYRSVAEERPNSFSSVPTIADWTSKEIEEFETEVEPMAQKLGYEYRVSQLPVPRQRQPPAAESGTVGGLFKTALSKLVAKVY